MTPVKKQSGFVLTTELIILATIMTIGSIIGFGIMRDAVVTELLDIADSIEAKQQYAFDGTLLRPNPYSLILLCWIMWIYWIRLIPLKKSAYWIVSVLQQLITLTLPPIRTALLPAPNVKTSLLHQTQVLFLLILEISFSSICLIRLTIYTAVKLA